MLLAEIQANFGLDPRFKHSGVTNWEVVLKHFVVNSEGKTDLDLRTRVLSGNQKTKEFANELENPAYLVG